MRIKMLEASNTVKLQDGVNRAIEKLEESGYKVVDVQYRTCPSDDENFPFSVLIAYERKGE